jgi:hypothetical protein
MPVHETLCSQNFLHECKKKFVALKIKVLVVFGTQKFLSLQPWYGQPRRLSSGAGAKATGLAIVFSMVNDPEVTALLHPELTLQPSVTLRQPIAFKVVSVFKERLFRDPFSVADPDAHVPFVLHVGLLPSTR